MISNEGLTSQVQVDKLVQAIEYIKQKVNSKWEADIARVFIASTVTKQLEEYNLSDFKQADTAEGNN